MTAVTNPWIPSYKPGSRARLRLFCFPFAGGGASLYADWRQRLPPEIDVCAVQLPGRESRLAEPAFTRIGPLVDARSRVLTPCLDLPFALFGHSMGAVVAYETALRLRAYRETFPVHLVASARQAPHIPSAEDPSYTLSDEAFTEKLRRLQGTPQEVLDHPELMELLLPLLRADFELNERYTCSTYEKLDCPVTAFAATGDKEVERDDLAAWRETTRGPFQLRLFPGDHFFILRQPETVTAAVKDVLTKHL